MVFQIQYVNLNIARALWVKIDEKKDHHPTCPIVPRKERQVYHSNKIYDNMIFNKPSSIE